MEVRPGPKRAELGVFPEEWQVTKVENLADCITVGFVGLMAHLFVDEGIPLLRGKNILPNLLDLEDTKLISPETHRQWEKSALIPGDVVIVRVGYPGTACVIPEDLGEVNAASLVVVRPNRNLVDSDFLCGVFNSPWGATQIRTMLVGGAQQVLNTHTAASFVIPLPPLPEQRAIAAVLSDVDALITALDKLIAKKRDIKKAAMQQLLTGKKRLPGFSGEWEVKKLGDVLKVCHGKGQRGIVANDGQYPILATGGEIGRTSAFLHDKPSVLIGRKGTIDVPQYVDTPFWTIDTLFFTNICESVVAKFIFYKFNMIDWYAHNEASGVPSLNASTIEAIEFRCPNTKEQAAIASVLSDMDAEIAALEQRRDKTRALKQGMMQELLTGRIRLVAP